MHAERVLLGAAAPEAQKALGPLDAYIRQCGLPKRLIDLVKLRASQINGCAFCLDKHSRDARREGESEQRLFLLSGWRESPVFSPAERAVLAWTEALTRLAETGAPDPDYEALRAHFSEKEIVDLTLLIGQINLLNRIGVGLRYVPDAEPWEAAR